MDHTHSANGKHPLVWLTHAEVASVIHELFCDFTANVMRKPQFTDYATCMTISGYQSRHPTHPAPIS